MASSLVVLRNAALLMLLLATVAGLYARNVTRLSTDASAQSAATAAAQTAVELGWNCQPTPPPEAATAAARAAWNQTGHLAVQPLAIEVLADACNLIASVTAAPLDARLSALQTTATACRSAASGAVLGVPGSC